MQFNFVSLCCASLALWFSTIYNHNIIHHMTVWNWMRIVASAQVLKYLYRIWNVYTMSFFLSYPENDDALHTIPICWTGKQVCPNANRALSNIQTLDYSHKKRIYTNTVKHTRTHTYAAYDMQGKRQTHTNFTQTNTLRMWASSLI